MRWIWVILLLIAPNALAAQAPGRGAMRDRVQLERQVLQRFAQQLGKELQLDATARAELEDWLMQAQQRRRALAREMMTLRRDLMQAAQNPGTTDAEFTRILDRIRQLRREEVEHMQRDEEALSRTFTPRQRAQIVLGMARLQERVRDIIAGRRGPGGGP